MTEFKNILELLQCPICGLDFEQKNNQLVCIGKHSHKYPIVNGIVRFVGNSDELNYTEHWNLYKNNNISEKKLQHGKNFVEWILDGVNGVKKESVILDVGCGDGSHLSFLPQEAIKIALDYSSSVDIVRQRYSEIENLYVIQGDALNLPFKAEAIDYYLAYGSINCTPDICRGISEAERVVGRGGLIGFWGYGTESELIHFGIAWSRFVYRLLPFKWMRRSFIYALMPVFYFINNSTNMKPGENSLRELEEIISTNLAPEHLYVFRKDSWKDYAPKNLKLVKNYILPCGQQFKKNGN